MYLRYTFSKMMSSVPEFFASEEAFYYLYGSNVPYKETFSDVWNNCAKLSVFSVFYIIYNIIMMNLFFGFVVSTGRVSQPVFNILSGISGLYLLSTLQSTYGKFLIFLFFSYSYFLLYIGYYIQSIYDPPQKCNVNKIWYFSNSNIIKYVLITLLILCQYYLLEAETWLEIRGVIMVFSMKLISLAEDIDNHKVNFPPFPRYFGYIFCGANIMFGPWISFDQYITLYQQPSKKNFWWVYGILKALFASIFFLMVSNCWANYFITEDSNRLLVGFKEALSFRASHYFISYLSEVSMLAAGYKNFKVWNNQKNWRFFITDPLNIEFPNALATVVTYWNRPMHEFLKKYIYRAWLPLGKFNAVLMTFIISSFLHGFELRISVVLIMMGIYSYLECAVRNQLAHTFSACIKVHRCKASRCKHKYKRNSLISRICLIVFSIITMLHLIYLGVLMDPSTADVGIYEKWNNLYFFSFWIMLINILIII